MAPSLWSIVPPEIRLPPHTDTTQKMWFFQKAWGTQSGMKPIKWLIWVCIVPESVGSYSFIIILYFLLLFFYIVLLLSASYLEFLWATTQII